MRDYEIKIKMFQLIRDITYVRESNLFYTHIFDIVIAAAEYSLEVFENCSDGDLSCLAAHLIYVWMINIDLL